MTLHQEGIHIFHILKQWLRRPYRYSLSAKNLDESIGQNGICMVKADTHVVWYEFNTEGPEGQAHCAGGRTTMESR